MSNYAAAGQFISDERLDDLKRQGAKARMECRSRAPYLGSSVESKAFQSGWDEENQRIELAFTSAAIR